jgi:hypothetical protein
MLFSGLVSRSIFGWRVVRAFQRGRITAANQIGLRHSTNAGSRAMFWTEVAFEGGVVLLIVTVTIFRLSTVK